MSRGPWAKGREETTPRIGVHRARQLTIHRTRLQIVLPDREWGGSGLMPRTPDPLSVCSRHYTSFRRCPIFSFLASR